MFLTTVNKIIKIETKSNHQTLEYCDWFKKIISWLTFCCMVVQRYDGRKLDVFSLVKLSGLIHEDSMVGIPSHIQRLLEKWK